MMREEEMRELLTDFKDFVDKDETDWYWMESYLEDKIEAFLEEKRK